MNARTSTRGTERPTAPDAPTAPDLFRRVFRLLPTGVAIVTSRLADQRHGMVVSSLISLSTERPLVAFSARRKTRTHGLVEASRVFAAHLLGEDQVALFRRFAGLDPVHDDARFAGLPTTVAATGAPVLPDAAAWVDCRVVDQLGGAGLTLFVGEVLDAALGDRASSAPLVYVQRTLRRLGPAIDAGAAGSSARGGDRLAPGAERADQAPASAAGLCVIEGLPT
jgi:flavin reductase (DIM6/NTAB) family NADH-FMN oxidoreductase RutF